MNSMEVRYYGNRVKRVTGDGAHWREAAPAELRYLLENEPGHRVIVGSSEPCAAGCYASAYLPGRHPFLVGISHLVPVYAEVICLGGW